MKNTCRNCACPKAKANRVDYGYATSASHSVPVYALVIATNTYSSCPLRDGQAELTKVAVHILRWFTHLLKVAHLSTSFVKHYTWTTPSYSWTVLEIYSLCQFLHSIFALIVYSCLMNIGWFRNDDHCHSVSVVLTDFADVIVVCVLSV